MSTPTKLLRDSIAASRARSLLVYPLDMSRHSLDAKQAQASGSLHSSRSRRFDEVLK